MAETRSRHVAVANEKSWREPVLRNSCNAEKISAMKKGSLTLVALLTAGFIMTGTYSCQSIGDIAVLLSWLLLFLPVAFSWTALFRILKMGDAVTWKQYKKGPERLSQSGAFGALISAAAVFCCGYFIVTGDVESTVVEIGMLVRLLFEFLLTVGTMQMGKYYLSQLEEQNV